MLATINISALQHNFSQVQKLAKNQSILAMIKSNGYGHGLVRVAKQLSSAQAFGVASLEEATLLREAGIKNSIVVMAGFYHQAEIPIFVKQQLTAVIHEPGQMVALEEAKFSELSTWLKIDTGMHRLGFPVDQVTSVYARLQALSGIQKPEIQSSVLLGTPLEKIP